MFQHQLRLQAPARPDDAVAMTIGAMAAMAIHAGTTSPMVNQAAAAIARACGQFQQACQVKRLYEWIRKVVRFKPDPINMEHLRYPDQLLAEIEFTPEGMAAADCDCQSMLTASILIALGIPAVFVVDGRSADGVLEHVYVAAELNGKLIPMDAQHRTPLGSWPEAGRRKAWRVEEPAE